MDKTLLARSEPGRVSHETLRTSRSMLHVSILSLLVQQRSFPRPVCRIHHGTESQYAVDWGKWFAEQHIRKKRQAGGAPLDTQPATEGSYPYKGCYACRYSLHFPSSTKR